MKIVFISSGNKPGGISPLVLRQGKSLEQFGAEVVYWTIKGKGLTGYLKSIRDLRKRRKQFHADVYHAHYSFSGFAAALAGLQPLVVSLMGSDVHSKKSFARLIRIFSRRCWKTVIVKEEKMKAALALDNIAVIPNGVNTVMFVPMQKEECQCMLGWDSGRSHILFAAGRSVSEKNFSLANDAYAILREQENVELHWLEEVAPDQVPVWMNAADVVLLTSISEGSPNVIKEAMACNRPVVATPTGDIEWLFGQTDGCYLTGFDVQSCVSRLQQALAFSREQQVTRGRERIIDLGIDSDIIAKKIMNIYTTLLSK